MFKVGNSVIIKILFPIVCQRYCNDANLSWTGHSRLIPCVRCWR